MRKFGLIGFPLGHSFSKKYFTQKFAEEGISDAVYDLYELPDLTKLPELLARNPELCGLNVTIPYKQAIIPFLDELSPTAARIGAVNVIRISEGKLTGYNSDYEGFLQSLRMFYPQHSGSQALVLGSGGASKAVQAALENLSIPYRVVSRNPEAGELSYDHLTPEVMETCDLIINATPLGTFPEVDSCPPIPYQYLTFRHFLYDLVYNPSETLFMKKGKGAGAQVKNGAEMLQLQAEAAWQIWNA
jgi:shikimate dehydrogenase